jgi:transposase
LSGIVHLLKLGGRWTDCSTDCDPKKSVYNRFARWAERGTWEDIFAAVAGRNEDAKDEGSIDKPNVGCINCRSTRKTIWEEYQ